MISQNVLMLVMFWGSKRTLSKEQSKQISLAAFLVGNSDCETLFREAGQASKEHYLFLAAIKIANSYDLILEIAKDEIIANSIFFNYISESLKIVLNSSLKSKSSGSDFYETSMQIFFMIDMLIKDSLEFSNRIDYIIDFFSLNKSLSGNPLLRLLPRLWIIDAINILPSQTVTQESVSKTGIFVLMAPLLAYKFLRHVCENFRGEYPYDGKEDAILSLYGIPKAEIYEGARLALTFLKLQSKYFQDNPSESRLLLVIFDLQYVDAYHYAASIYSEVMNLRNSKSLDMPVLVDFLLHKASNHTSIQWLLSAEAGNTRKLKLEVEATKIAMMLQ